MGVGGQRHTPAALPPWKTLYPLHRRLSRPQGRFGQLRKISSPPGFDTRTVQSVASRYTRWATPVLRAVPGAKNKRHWKSSRFDLVLQGSVGMVPQIRPRRPEGPNEWRRPPDIVTVMKRTSRLCDMVADTTQQGMISTGRKESWQHDITGWGVADLCRSVQTLPNIIQLQV